MQQISFYSSQVDKDGEVGDRKKEWGHGKMSPHIPMICSEWKEAIMPFF